jgi:hypothetical protein
VIIEEYRRINAGNGTFVDVNKVNAELTIVLNGMLLAILTGPESGQDNYNRNITNNLISGQNILVFTLLNLGGESSEVSLDASVSIGAERINLNQKAIAPPGLFYQAFFF